jgi:hypothetical protein
LVYVTPTSHLTSPAAHVDNPIFETRYSSETLCCFVNDMAHPVVFSDLPSNCIQTIANFLDLPADRVNFASTNKDVYASVMEEKSWPTMSLKFDTYIMPNFKYSDTDTTFSTFLDTERKWNAVGSLLTTDGKLQVVYL